MKKTVSINLNSLVFIIDEDAYLILSEYLQSLNNYFSKLEEGAEIIADIEARIAELFSEKISQSKQVLNKNDVDDLIAQLGKAEEIIGDETYETDEAKSDEFKENRKLYRDIENRVLGGVCAGFSHYIGLNLEAIRVIFIILFFISAGSVSLVYFILWIIIPKAETVAERLEMKGKKINISNIENTIKEEYQGLKNRFNKIKDSDELKETTKKYSKSFVEVMQNIFNVFSKFIAIVFIIAGIFLIAFFCLSLFSFSSDFFIIEISGNKILPIPQILELFTNSTTTWLFLISIFVVVLIPLISMVYAGISILLKLKTPRVLNWSMLIVWLMGLSLLVALAISLSADFVNSGEIVTSENLQTNAEKRIFVNMETDKLGQGDFELKEIGNYKILMQNQNLTTYGNAQINLYHTADSLAYLEIVKTGRGATKSEATFNAKNMSYYYVIQDSCINIDSFFKINDDVKIRNQSLSLNFYLPNYFSIKFDEQSLKLLNESIIPDSKRLPRMVQAVFLMQNKELQLVSE